MQNTRTVILDCIFFELWPFEMENGRICILVKKLFIKAFFIKAFYVNCIFSTENIGLYR